MNTVMLRVFYKGRDFSVDFDMPDAETAERILQSIATKLETQSIVTFAYGSEYCQNTAMITKNNLEFIKVTVPVLSPDSDKSIPDPISSMTINKDAFFGT